MHNAWDFDEHVYPMKQEDLHDVLAIEKCSFLSPWSQRLFEEALASPISINLVVKKGKSLIGYFIMYNIEDEVHILNVAVHPDYRGKGYGTKLLHHVLTTFHKERTMEFFLEVRESNTAAIHLYRKFGFEIIGKRRRYYSETNEDALVMSLLREGQKAHDSAQ